MQAICAGDSGKRYEAIAWMQHYFMCTGDIMPNADEIHLDSPEYKIVYEVIWVLF